MENRFASSKVVIIDSRIESRTFRVKLLLLNNLDIVSQYYYRIIRSYHNFVKYIL